MGNKVRVSINSDMPVADAGWTVDVTDDVKQSLIYSNLAYDLIAIAMGKLGVAMSEHILGDDTKINRLAEEANGRVE
jgi:hypothetical protein